MFYISWNNGVCSFKRFEVVSIFVKFVHDFFITRIQSCAKLVGTPTQIFVIFLIIKRSVCVKASMFKAYFLNLLPPPPSPTKQCWGAHTPPSFTVYHHYQHCFRGAGSVIKITKCPNSFAQDCIQLMKKSCTNFYKNAYNFKTLEATNTIFSGNV